MKRVFGVKKEKTPPASLEETTERINKSGEGIDEKIRKLEAELVKYREQIKKTRPGPAQEALKARAMRLLKQKKMYENQRDTLYAQTFNLEQVTFAKEGIVVAQQTVEAMKAAKNDLKSSMKTMNLSDIDKLQDQMLDLVDYSNEVQESLGRSYNVPDDLDEEELMGELSALEAEMNETDAAVPSYLQPEEEELNLPAAPSASQQAQAEAADEFGFPAVPRASLRT